MILMDSGIFVFVQPSKSVFVLVSIMALQFSRESYTLLAALTTIHSSFSQPLYLQLIVYQFVLIKTVEK